MEVVPKGFRCSRRRGAGNPPRRNSSARSGHVQIRQGVVVVAPWRDGLLAEEWRVEKAVCRESAARERRA